MLYDGRSFLDTSVLTPFLGITPTTWTTTATYSSEGVLHHRHLDRPKRADQLRTDPAVVGDDYVVYFAGRPLAQLSVRTSTVPGEEPEESSRLVYLTTDHLGTPVLATDGSGGVVWQGGFEPFGADYSGASEAGVFLRFPGQWVDTTWETRVLPDFFSNLMRWYHGSLGLYTRTDPFRHPFSRQLYVYANGRATFFVDPFGLRALIFTGCEVLFFDDDWNIERKCSAGSGLPGTTSTDQGVPYKGPIPEGKYYVSPWEFSGGLRSLARDPGWGWYRVPLHPAPQTDTLGRDGFFLHGDRRENRPSTAGCIDIGDCDTWAREWALEEPTVSIPLYVYYVGRVCN